MEDNFEVKPYNRLKKSNQKKLYQELLINDDISSERLQDLDSPTSTADQTKMSAKSTTSKITAQKLTIYD